MLRSIELPPRVSKLPEYIEHGSGRIDVVLSGDNLRRFRQLKADLAAGARFSNGAPVARHIDVINWLLEQSDKSTTTTTTTTKTTRKRSLNGSGASGSINEDR